MAVQQGVSLAGVLQSCRTPVRLCCLCCFSFYASSHTSCSFHVAQRDAGVKIEAYGNRFERDICCTELALVTLCLGTSELNGRTEGLFPWGGWLGMLTEGPAGKRPGCFDDVQCLLLSKSLY